MAIQNLISEFEGLAEVLSGAIARKSAEVESNDMDFEFSKMFKGLMGHYFEGSSGKKVDKAGKFSKKKQRYTVPGTSTAQYIGQKAGAKEIVEKYVTETIDALYVQFSTDSKKRFIIEEYTKGKSLHVYCFKIGEMKDLKGSPNPYGALRDESTKVYNKVVSDSSEYKRLFWGDASAVLGKGGLKKSKYSMSNALNAGHLTGVSGNLAHATHDAVNSMLEDLDNVNIPETDPAFKDYKFLRMKVKRQNMDLGRIVLRVGHDRPAFKDNKISSNKIVFETNRISLEAEGAKTNSGKEWESAAGNAVRKMKNDLAKDIEDFYKKHPIWAREGSKSIRNKVRDSFASPKLRKLAKKKALETYKKPGGRQKTPLKPIEITKATLISKSEDGQPMGDTKGKGKRAVARGAQQGPNITSLQALINAKLPQTVAQNMGPPGLENRTGRFASSVHITDVSQTAQGYPSIGYNYQRNPYQVFEMTHGDPRWATPDRDPRKLIDSSIREIAAQLAIGRFYTRRI